MKWKLAPSLGLIIALAVPSVGFSQSVKFGDNKSEYANDGECDDRRFIGQGMATSLDEDDNFHDANDCRKLYRAGMIKLTSEKLGRAATNCSKIKFGNNSSKWARDGECDDARFDGPGSDGIIAVDDVMKDARDCKRQCQAGNIWLRTAAQ